MKFPLKKLKGRLRETQTQIKCQILASINSPIPKLKALSRKKKEKK